MLYNKNIYEWYIKKIVKITINYSEKKIIIFENHKL